MSPEKMTIRTDCTDTELNEAVAEHVAGWKRMTLTYSLVEETGLVPPDGLIENHPVLPPFATDANAVLPLLAQCPEGWAVDYEVKRKTYYVVICSSDYDASGSTAPTFCRAACYALLRANGVTVVD